MNKIMKTKKKLNWTFHLKKVSYYVKIFLYKLKSFSKTIVEITIKMIGLTEINLVSLTKIFTFIMRAKISFSIFNKF
jgi:hypothetical protein